MKELLLFPKIHKSIIEFYQIVMDILREFLESSTIHGLARISSAEVSFKYLFNYSHRFYFRQSQPRSFGLELCLFASLHNVQFVKYDVTVSFMAQVLDTVTYLVPQVLDTAS